MNEKTLGELIANRYADFDIIGGTASMDMDITNGVEIETADNTEYGHGISVSIYPYVKWSDGCYKPCRYWGSEFYIYLHK